MDNRWRGHRSSEKNYIHHQQATSKPHNENTLKRGKTAGRNINEFRVDNGDGDNNSTDHHRSRRSSKRTGDATAIMHTQRHYCSAEWPVGTHTHTHAHTQHTHTHTSTNPNLELLISILFITLFKFMLMCACVRVSEGEKGKEVQGNVRASFHRPYQFKV